MTSLETTKQIDKLLKQLFDTLDKQEVTKLVRQILDLVQTIKFATGKEFEQALSISSFIDCLNSYMQDKLNDRPLDFSRQLLVTSLVAIISFLQTFGE